MKSCRYLNASLIVLCLSVLSVILCSKERFQPQTFVKIGNLWTVEEKRSIYLKDKKDEFDNKLLGNISRDDKFLVIWEAMFFIGLTPIRKIQFVYCITVIHASEA